jgi:hypothetical protein
MTERMSYAQQGTHKHPHEWMHTLHSTHAVRTQTHAVRRESRSSYGLTQGSAPPLTQSSAQTNLTHGSTVESRQCRKRSVPTQSHTRQCRAHNRAVPLIPTPPHGKTSGGRRQCRQHPAYRYGRAALQPIFAHAQLYGIRSITVALRGALTFFLLTIPMLPIHLIRLAGSSTKHRDSRPRAYV